jgi:hypothetical protein
MYLRNIGTILIIVLLAFIFSTSRSDTLSIIESSQAKLVLSFTPDKITYRNILQAGDLFTEVSIPGYPQLSLEGKPSLPYKSFLIAIPDSHTPQIRIINEESFLKDTKKVKPPYVVSVQENFSQRETAPRNVIEYQLLPDQKIYHSDSFFPKIPADVAFEGYIRFQKVALIRIFPVQYNPSRNELKILKKIELLINFMEDNELNQEKKRIYERYQDSETAGHFQKMLKNLIINSDTFESNSNSISSALPIQNSLEGDSFLHESYFSDSEEKLSSATAGEITPTKIFVSKEGIYTVTYDDLVSAGLNLSGIDPRTFKLHNKGEEIAIYVFGESDGAFDPGDYFDFYGLSMTGDYTETNVYWLTSGGNNGLRMTEKDGAPSYTVTVPTTFPNTLYEGEDNIYTQNPPSVAKDHWWWEKLIAPVSSDYTNSLLNISTDPDQARIRMDLQGRTATSTNPDHHTRLSLNAIQIDDQYWDGQIPFTHDVYISHSLLAEGSNTLTIDLVGDTGSTVDSLYSNWYQIDYRDRYVAEDSLLTYNGEGPGDFQFEVENFSSNTIETFDVTDPKNTLRILNADIILDGSTYKNIFEDTITQINLLQYSEEFDRSVWERSPEISVEPDATKDKNGYYRADKLEESSSTTSSNVKQEVSESCSSKTFVFSVWLRAGSNVTSSIAILEGDSGNNILSTEGGSGTYSSPGIWDVDLSTSWQRFWIKVAFSSLASGNATVYIYPTSFSGQGNRTIYAWGAQFEESTILSDYEKKTDFKLEKYISLVTTKKLSADDIKIDEVSDLKSTFNEADYIIITHEDFYDSILPLANHRSSKGKRVEVVKITDVYDEFNYGIFSPLAIRDFLDYVFFNWVPPAPEFVLLVGDANIDYKDNYELGNINYVPAYLVDTPNFGQAPSDNWYTFVSGDDILPDLYIGRISVRTASDADTVVSKIIDYETSPPLSELNEGSLFIADDDDVTFEAVLNDLVMTYLPPTQNAHKVYLSQYSLVDNATNEIKTHINNGALITTYLGHGNRMNWAAEDLWINSDISALSNGPKQTFVVALNCINGYFTHITDTEKYSMGEEFIRLSGKGAISAWSPSGLGDLPDYDTMSHQLFHNIFDNHNTVLGSAAIEALITSYVNYGVDERNIKSMIFFGDPATELAVDSDHDSLLDKDEVEAGSDPKDEDSDDDGIRDDQEPSWSSDTDGDGYVNASDPDSDNDGLLDGTEMGVTDPLAGTDTTKGNFVVDSDPLTTTDPLDPDSDDGGSADGAEDRNANGQIDLGETDPTSGHGDDDPVCDTNPPPEIEVLIVSKYGNGIVISWNDISSSDPCILYRVYYATNAQPKDSLDNFQLLGVTPKGEFTHALAYADENDYDYLVSGFTLSGGEGPLGHYGQ